MNAISMQVLSLLHIHFLWHVEICQIFMLKIILFLQE